MLSTSHNWLNIGNGDAEYDLTIDVPMIRSTGAGGFLKYGLGSMYLTRQPGNLSPQNYLYDGTLVIGHTLGTSVPARAHR